MTNIDILKDYLTEITCQEGSVDVIAILQEIEVLLGNSEASHQRILYLEELAVSEFKFPDSLPLPLNDPLTSNQYVACVEKGIVDAYKDGDVPFEKILVLAHSIDGLRIFADTLFEIPEERHAQCWKHAIKAPFKTTKIDLTAIWLEVSKESLWDQISKAAYEWIVSLSPEPRVPVLGFRCLGSDQTKQNLDPNKALQNPEQLVRQIDTLIEFSTDSKSMEIAEILKRVPWDDLKASVNEGINWQSFLNNTGRLFRSELSSDDFIVLNEWLEMQDLSSHPYYSELKLLELILISRGFVDN